VARIFLPGTLLFGWLSTGRSFYVAIVNRTYTHEIQNTNSVTHCLIYTFETEINLLEFNPAYPKEPKSLGERIRKARMDKGLLIRQLAAQIGVTEDTVINWEIRDIKPVGRNLVGVKEFLKNSC
jgi:DNA-binding transcriptional regulator YiaG